MSQKLFRPILLLVTENPSIRHWVKKHLEERFFILEAQTRLKAMDAVLTTSLELILLDAQFDDALELCKEIKKNLVPIFLITGRLKKSFREKAVDAGVSDFLSSQLDLEELEAKITAAKRAQEVREKTSDLSSAISNQKKEPSQTYWKNKKLDKKKHKNEK